MPKKKAKLNITINNMFKPYKLIISCVIFLSVTVGYSQPKTIQVIDEVIAVVGNTPILRSELDILVTQLDPEIVPTDEVRCDLLQRLLINKMLVHQALIDSIPLTDAEVEDRIDNNLRIFERQMNNKANLEKYLGMTTDEYKKQIFHKLKAQMLMEKMEQSIKSEIKITPKEVRDFYNNLPVDSLPYISAEVEIASLVLKPKPSKDAIDFAKEEIALLKERIEGGESFARLAGIYSEDPGSKRQGGLLPEFGRGDMVPEFERTAYSLKKDSMSDIIETAYGFHILKLIDKRGDKVTVRHILIRPKLLDSDIELTKERIDSVYQLIESGKIKWCDAVKNYSEDEMTKPFCGFLTDESIGTQRIPFEYLDKDISKIASAMKPGEYYAPEIAYSQDGTPYYRIIYLKDETKPHVANLEMDWQRIQLLAMEDKKEKQMDKWSEKKKKETYISIKKDYLNCDYFNDWITKK